MERIVKRQRGILDSLISDALDDTPRGPAEETDRPGRPGRPTRSEEEEDEEATTQTERATTIVSVGPPIVNTPTTTSSRSTTARTTASSTTTVRSLTAPSTSATQASPPPRAVTSSSPTRNTSAPATDANASALPSQAKSESNGNGNGNGGTIAGVIGGIAALLLLFGVFVVWRKRRTAAQREAEEQDAIQRAGLRGVSPVPKDDDPYPETGEYSHDNPSSFAPQQPEMRAHSNLDPTQWHNSLPAQPAYPASPSWHGNASDLSITSATHLPVGPMPLPPQINQGLVGQEMAMQVPARGPLIFNDHLHATEFSAFENNQPAFAGSSNETPRQQREFDSFAGTMQQQQQSEQEVIGTQEKAPILVRQDSSVARPISDLMSPQTFPATPRDAAFDDHSFEKRQSVRASQVPLPGSPISKRISKAPQLDFRKDEADEGGAWMNVMFGQDSK